MSLKGKVVSYDSSQGRGKIFIKNEGVKTFEVENWIDYDKTPEVGLEVEFRLDNDELVEIATIDFTKQLSESLNNSFQYVLPNDLAIKEDVSLNYCLEEFFDKFKNIALKYESLLESKKSLPYKKIKRFIFTAYNNLLDIDFKINDKNLIEIKNSLDEIEYYYNLLLNETKNPIYVTLEKLVLNKQKNYLVLKKRFENNKTLITEATKNANLLEMKIETLKMNLKKISPKSKEYIEKSNLLKSYKRKYVDLIDMAQDLKEENANITNDINQFEKVYQEIFEKFFNKEVHLLLNVLLKELNILSYQFDTVLWENAKKSKQIQHFFKEAKIEGAYSTKTFMKYYLKNLKTDKMNSKDIELLDIFNELKLFTKSIIVYTKSLARARDISRTIENLDHDNNVKIFSIFKEFISYLKQNTDNLDVVVIEVDKSIKVSANNIVKVLEQLGIKYLLFSDEVKSDIIVSSDNLYKQLKMVI